VSVESVMEWSRCKTAVASLAAGLVSDYSGYAIQLGYIWFTDAGLTFSAPLCQHSMIFTCTCLCDVLLTKPINKTINVKKITGS